jgi:phosphoribosylformylglycinamidine synthase
MDAKHAGDLVYVIGDTKDELGAGEYYETLGYVGLNVPEVQAQEVLPLYQAIHRVIREGLVSSCHAVARGGLAVHLALVAMAGEVGMEIDLRNMAASPGLSDSRILYSESCGRFIATVTPKNRVRFEQAFNGIKGAQVGVVTDTSSFKVRGTSGEPIIEEEISEIKASWKKPFEELI